jgi:hypothetical protein
MLHDAHTHLFANYSGAASRGALTPLVRASTAALVASFANKINRTLLTASAAGNTVGVASVFIKDYLPPSYLHKLPGPNERLVNTQQFALCLGRLQASPLRPWLRAYPIRAQMHHSHRERFKRTGASQCHCHRLDRHLLSECERLEGHRRGHLLGTIS